MIHRLPYLFAVAAVLAAFAAAPARAQQDFVWETPDQVSVRDLLEIETFHTNFINTGTTTDSFRVFMTVEAPSYWVTSMCEGTFCYAPFVREFDFELAPGDTNKLGTNITAITDLGRAVATVTVTNLAAPQLTDTRSFVLITRGFDVLVVSADPALDPSQWITAAMDAVGKSSVAIPRTGDGKLAAEDYTAFATVVLAAGRAVDALGAVDRDALAAYVQQGGHVWLHGGNFIWGLSAPSSPAYSPAAVAWFQVVAGLVYAGTGSGGSAVVGWPGDELAEGLTLVMLPLNGGDGAWNNGDIDFVMPFGGGMDCLAYTLGVKRAGVRRVYGAGRVVTTGFSLEGLGSAAARSDLASAVLDWFANGVSAADDTPAAGLVGLPRAVPNPFNPRTSIRFAVGGTRPGHVTVTVHDVRGRVVRRLFAGAVEPGSRALIWDGRDDTGRSLAAGAYLARVQVGAEIAAVKLTLAK